MMREDWKTIERAAKRAGRDPTAIRPSYFLFIAIGRSKDEVLEQIRVPGKLLLMNAPANLKRLGYDNPSIYTFPPPQALAKRLERTHEIPDAILEKWFAFGSPDDVLEKISEYHRIANSQHLLLFPYLAPTAKTFLEDFSAHILPHFR
jgi:alkanesulfonate monooxygenase SsuD/methylene tetrahydromethanopterin reductase-like flavin-dependent oxidoreductase (luciferase family)